VGTAELEAQLDPPILYGLGAPSSADQLDCLGGRMFFDPTVLTAVPGPDHHSIVTKPPAQQGMITEQMVVIQKPVDLFFGQNPPRRQLRPDDP